jgi:acyl-coenzyme A thioesterase 13
MIYSFLKAAKKGETLVIDAETVKLGRTLAFLSVEFRNKQNNELLATGKHTKYVG